MIDYDLKFSHTSLNRLQDTKQNAYYENLMSDKVKKMVIKICFVTRNLMTKHNSHRNKFFINFLSTLSDIKFL